MRPDGVAATPPSGIRWLLLVQGLGSIGLGVLVFAWPAVTLEALLLAFAVCMLLFGVLAIIRSIGLRRVNSGWWAGVLLGLLAVASGVATLLAPGITALALLYWIAAWAIIVGVIEIAQAIRSRRPAFVRVVYGIAGFFSALLGIVLIAVHPTLGVLTVLWLVGLYAIVIGVFWSYCALTGERPAPFLGSGVRDGPPGGTISPPAG